MIFFLKRNKGEIKIKHKKKIKIQEVENENKIYENVII